MVNLSITVHIDKRGPSYWKFNNSLLLDSCYTLAITNLISKLKSDYNDRNPSFIWEYTKYSVRKFTIDYSKRKAHNIRNKESVLVRNISLLEQDYFNSNSDIVFQSLMHARTELQTLYDYKLHGIVIRSRARWVDEGERNTKYFLNLESRNKSNNVIRKLKRSDGFDTCKSSEILSELRKFYKCLYSSENCDPSLIFNHIACNNTLSFDDAARCDGKLNLHDCKDALVAFKNGKSPASDGLSAEFYKHFWQIIGELVTNSLNFSYDNIKLSDEQGRSTITLIPKPQKDPTLCTSYRPISLLNIDYKICAKVLATKLKTIIHLIIDSNQTGFIKNRFIGENIRFIIDLIDHCNDRNITGLLLLVDFEKAFDRLEWNFILHCLNFFNFNDSFIRWVRTLYSNSTACVCNNGYSSAFFTISRGVRQGCPLSPYIFYYMCRDPCNPD